MTRPLLLLSAAALAAACTGPLATRNAPLPPTPEDAELRFGGSYRFARDPCRRVGETDLTRPHVNAQSDLVACPVAYEGRGRFAIDSQSTELARTENWVVYSVPIP